MNNEPLYIAIISPCASGPCSVEENKAYAASLAKAVALSGHIPVVPHLSYTQFLDDSNETERVVGLRLGGLEMRDSHCVIVGKHNGVQGAMVGEIEEMERFGKPIRYLWHFDEVEQAILEMSLELANG